MRRGSGSQVTESLDSLVDIVSNSVGILIILAVFMALLSVVGSPLDDRSPEKTNDLLIIEKKRIPWSHSSQKSSLLFVLQDNRCSIWIVWQPIVRSKAELDGESELPRWANLDGYHVELTAQSSQNHCLQFPAGKGQWWGEVSRADGWLTRLLAEKSPSEEYLFFWADGASFELMREIREWTWDQRYEVGWKPITERSGLRFVQVWDDPKFPSTMRLVNSYRLGENKGPLLSEVSESVAENLSGRAFGLRSGKYSS